jgi:hypothetical protein
LGISPSDAGIGLATDKKEKKMIDQLRGAGFTMPNLVGPHIDKEKTSHLFQESIKTGNKKVQNQSGFPPFSIIKNSVPSDGGFYDLTGTGILIAQNLKKCQEKLMKTNSFLKELSKLQLPEFISREHPPKAVNL